jgi:predicted Zn-dependent protease
MLKAGYDPAGLITFLTKIQKVGLASAPQIPPYLSTHPVTENRVSLLENLIQMGGKPGGPFRSMGNFKKIQMRAFVEEREAQASIIQFQSVAETRPQDAEGYYGLGLAYRKMGRLDKSAEFLQKGATIAPTDPDLLSELGIVYFLSGKLDLAIKTLEAGQSLSRARADSYEDLSSVYYLGRGYQERGEMAKALPFLLRVKNEFPEFSDVHYHLGSVYGRMGQKGLSHFYFGKYFKLRGEGNNALTHFRKAADLLGKGSPEKEEVQREIREMASPTK